MLYVYYGGRIPVRSAAQKTVDFLLHKKPDASFYRMSPDNWSISQCEEYIGRQGLFNLADIVWLDACFSEEEISDFLVSKLDALAGSQSIFIVTEEKINKPILTKLEKTAKEIKNFKDESVSERRFSLDSNTSISKNEFNPFALGDALVRRDKPALWAAHQESIHRGISAEETVGLLFWQVKSMLVATSAKTAEDADMKPFVFNKARAGAKEYSIQELRDLSHKLVKLYHDGHRGLGEMNVEVERVILGM